MILLHFRYLRVQKNLNPKLLKITKNVPNGQYDQSVQTKWSKLVNLLKNYQSGRSCITTVRFRALTFGNRASCQLLHQHPYQVRLDRKSVSYYCHNIEVI